MMATLHHPNIVQFLGFARLPALSLVIELFPEGSIEQFVPRHKPNFKVCIKFMKEMALAMEYLHSRTPMIIIHRDVKPANFLLTASRRVKLGDFGIARLPKVKRTKPNTSPYASPDMDSSLNKHLNVNPLGGGPNFDSENSLTEMSEGGSRVEADTPAKDSLLSDPRCVTKTSNDDIQSLYTSNCGTARYMAPEVASQREQKCSYSAAADIFSLAMVFYFVLERVPPAIPNCTSPQNYLAALAEGKRPAFHRTPRVLRDLIDAMWTTDHKKRPTASKCLDYMNLLRINPSVIPGTEGKVSLQGTFAL